MRLLVSLAFLLLIISCYENTHLKGITHRIGPSVNDTLLKPYTEVLAAIETRRKLFARDYQDVNHKKHVIDSVSAYWISAFDELYHHWKGTPWDFNGTTRQPGQGNIACGYFVTTLLQHMGYKLDRIKLSTCASLTMMRKLAPEQTPMNLSKLSYSDFTQKIKTSGKAMYVTGLDYHTGFLLNDGTESWFIHSNYIGRQGVMKEKIDESAALLSSKTRYVITLTADTSFLLRWMSIK